MYDVCNYDWDCGHGMLRDATLNLRKHLSKFVIYKYALDPATYCTHNLNADTEQAVN